MKQMPKTTIGDTGGRARAVLVALLFMTWLSPPAVLGQAPAGGRVRALFLGDNGHHRPADRAKSILPVLAANGVDLFYTDEPADLDPAVLRRYHAVVLYNNHPVVSPDQLAALLEFLKNGGGLVALHCASASFQNSETFIRVVGAAFKSHDTGVVRTTRLVPDHPVVRGVPEIVSWDETYVHTKQHPNRTVLEERIEGGHREPWTWVRSYGSGRVFYTAWGHDHRTWDNAAFQQLVTRAIHYVAGDWALERRPDTALLTTTLAAPRPLYEPPPAPWNTLAGFVDTAQAPLEPEDSYPLMTLRPGFRVEPFAAEPMIRRIIDFTWDERGRMWAIETNDYPNTLLPDGERGNDRVLILEDANRDGRADRVQVFADGLNLATSLVFAGGGLIVAQPPHILWFRDTNGDDRADERRILFSGWPREDTHGSVSNLRYGFDNHVWGSVGYNGFRGEVGGVAFGRGAGRILLGAGYFRFAPDGASLDYVARTSNNTWGLGLSEEGDVFGSTANRSASQYVHIPGRFYRDLIGQTPTLRSIADREDVFPLRQIYQVDQFGLYTAGTGHEVYTARAFPREYWNRMAFVADPTAHLVGMFELIPDGGGFRAKNRWSLMATRDGWQAPVQVKVGPDGAVWVSDFYTLITQHNPTPEDMERGDGNAYETPNRTADRGRIYRIVYDDAPAPRTTSLAGATPERLVAGLADDNMYWRLTAQRLLVERGETDVVPALLELLDDHTVDALALNAAGFHALWTLHGLGVIERDPGVADAVRRALHHPAGAVRRAALMTLPRDERLAEDIFTAGLLPDRASPHAVEYTVGSGALQDADPRVRLTALVTLAELPPSPRAAAAVVELLGVPQNARDPWLPDAAAMAGARQGPDVALALLGNRYERHDSAAVAGVARTVRLMAYHFAAQGNAPAVVALLEAVPESHLALARAVLAGIAGEAEGDERPREWLAGLPGAWPEDSPPDLTATQRDALREAARRAPAQLADGFQLVAARWGMPELFRSP
jgi:hypothetical protein